MSNQEVQGGGLGSVSGKVFNGELVDGNKLAGKSVWFEYVLHKMQIGYATVSYWDASDIQTNLEELRKRMYENPIAVGLTGFGSNVCVKDHNGEPIAMVNGSSEFTDLLGPEKTEELRQRAGISPKADEKYAWKKIATIKELYSQLQEIWHISEPFKSLYFEPFITTAALALCKFADGNNLGWGPDDFKSGVGVDATEEQLHATFRGMGLLPHQFSTYSERWDPVNKIYIAGDYAIERAEIVQLIQNGVISPHAIVPTLDSTYKIAVQSESGLVSAPKGADGLRYRRIEVGALVHDLIKKYIFPNPTKAMEWYKWMDDLLGDEFTYLRGNNQRYFFYPEIPQGTTEGTWWDSKNHLSMTWNQMAELDDRHRNHTIATAMIDEYCALRFRIEQMMAEIKLKEHREVTEIDTYGGYVSSDEQPNKQIAAAAILGPLKIPINRIKMNDDAGMVAMAAARHVSKENLVYAKPPRLIALESTFDLDPYYITWLQQKLLYEKSI